MNPELTTCPVCGAKISTAARHCVQCGHPMRSSSSNVKGIVLGITISVLGLVGLALYKANPEFISEFEAPDLSDFSLESLTDDPKVSEDSGSAFKPKFLRGEALHKELMAYTMRVNRLTPYKPNLLVTLQRLTYQKRPMALIFEYEMNAMSDKQPVDFEAIKPIQMRRYCTDPELSIAAYNGVPITWRYFKTGTLIHEYTIERCEQ